MLFPGRSPRPTLRHVKHASTHSLQSHLTIAHAAAPAPASATAATGSRQVASRARQTRPQAFPPTAHDRLVVDTPTRIPKGFVANAEAPPVRAVTTVPCFLYPRRQRSITTSRARGVHAFRTTQASPFVRRPPHSAVGPSTSGDLNHAFTWVARAGASTAEEAGYMGAVPWAARDPRRRRGHVHSPTACHCDDSEQQRHRAEVICLWWRDDRCGQTCTACDKSLATGYPRLEHTQAHRPG